MNSVHVTLWNVSHASLPTVQPNSTASTEDHSSPGGIIIPLYERGDEIFDNERLVMPDRLTKAKLHCACSLPHSQSRGDDGGLRFYRAMHFSAKRGIAIACRLSVRLSVRPSVCDVGEL